jgi:hypothetical protein
MSYKILSGVQADLLVLQQLEALDRRHRIIKPFTISAVISRGTTAAGDSVYQLGFVDKSGKLLGYGGVRQLIETQLMSFGLVSPDWTTQQLLVWRKLCLFLKQRGVEIPENIECRDCFEYSILGYLDRLTDENKISNLEYLSCRSQLKEIGNNQFAKDFAWYFGKAVPSDCYRWEEAAA